MIYPETARGKELVDAHFFVAVSHVHRWVRKSGNHLCTPRQLWAELHSCKSILNSRGELVTISCDGLHLGHWNSSMEANPRPLTKLGRVSEFFYGDTVDGTLPGTVYAYSGGHGTM